nr:PREDICTED: LOW QUALITY PROTEIN: condensin-2 complex subunit D3-like [Nicotiana tabacum]
MASKFSMEDTIQRIVNDLEITQTSISEQALIDLQTLLDHTLKTKDPLDIEDFYDELSSRKISPTSLINSISSTMDSAPLNISLLASKVYLSLLLTPNSPVFTLFTPMAFLSLLRSIRKGFKTPFSISSNGSGSSSQGKKKKGRARAVPGRKGGGRNSEDSANESEFDVRVLFIVLERLILVLGLVHLSRFPDCLRSLVQTMAEIAVTAVDICGVYYGRFCEICNQILSEVLKSEHGDQKNSAVEILKSLTPLILLVKSPAKTLALEFVVNRMIGLAKESDGIKEAVLNLPRYIVQKAPEKAEARAAAVEAIVEMVKVMNFEDQDRFASYVVKMSQGKPQLRLLAVDLIPALMMSLKDPFGWELDVEVENSWGLSCLEALIQRCSDVTAGTRARALTNLAQLVGFFSGNDKGRAVLKKFLGFDSVGKEVPESLMNGILKKRCMDEKAAVRKAALLVISKLTSFSDSAPDEDFLKTLGMSCSDPLVSIRKAAISALSEAFRIFTERNVVKEWLHSIPRLITDNESSIQEECETLFLELVLDRISRVGSSNSVKHASDSNSNGKAATIEMEKELLYPQGVLGILREICDGEVTPWVKKICTSLGKKKKLKPKIVITLQNIIRSSESLWLSNSMPIDKWTAPPGAWFLLSEVSAYLSRATDWEFLHHHWQILDKYKATGDHDSDEGLNTTSNTFSWAVDRVYLLQTIANVSLDLPPEPAADLAHNLLQRLEEFNMHPTEVSAHLNALKTLCKRKALNPQEADCLVMKWVNQLLSKASRILDAYLSKSVEEQGNDIFLTPFGGTTGKGKRAVASHSKSLQQTMTAVHTIGSLVIICPSANVSTVVPILHTIITSSTSNTRPKKPAEPSISIKQTAPSLYVQAWLTMAKICLTDGKLAKRYIPLFVQELEKGDCAALRNNIVVVMADFWVRYTALVDCYLPKITKSLRDSSEVVRRQTFILLSRLCQRDYVKVKGVLFFRFLLSLVDESEKIRQLADYLFGNILKGKEPLLAYNSFVEAMFVLNDCNPHTGCSNPQNSRNETRIFSIRGNDEKSRSSRMHIYVTLLKQMAPAHVLATFAKICAEILAAASDGLLNIDDATGQSVLQDAFQVLSSKEMRISSSRGSTSESADVEEEGADGGASSAANGRAITQAVKKSLIQNTIPIFVELKRLLESKNSPLTGSLMECLRNLLKDYKNEIDDMLVADKQLQKELVYDMQRYETMKAKSAAAEAVATMQRSELYRSPSNPMANSSFRNKKSDEGNTQIASAVADAVAAVAARSVLREVNKGTSTPPLSAMKTPRLKSNSGGTFSRRDMPAQVIESLRRRPTFDSDEEN